jgi:predicted DNA-binding transcriptional regulator YafY
MELTERERERLRELVEEARRRADDPLLASLSAKLAVSGGPAFAKYAEVLDAGAQAEPEILDAVRSAVRDERRLAIRYTARTSGETTDRVVRPFNIHFYDGREYLEAYCELRQADRVFAVGGIEAILPLPEEERAG